MVTDIIFGYPMITSVGGHCVLNQIIGPDGEEVRLFGQIVGRKDDQVVCRGETRAEVAKVGVEKLRFVDQADQVLGGVVQRDASAGAGGASTSPGPYTWQT